MPIATRLGTATTIQNAQAGAADGTALDIDEADSVIVEITGTYTGITANFEASLDGGTTWHIMALVGLASTSATKVTTAATNGLFQLLNISGLTHFRARTTVATPTDSMTVKARASNVA